MSHYFRIICDMVEASDLPPEERERLLMMLSFSEEDQLAEIVELINEDPLWIRRMSDDMGVKKQILELRDEGSDTIFRNNKDIFEDDNEWTAD